MTSRLRFRGLQWGLIVLGLVLVGLWSASALESSVFQSSESKRFDAALIEARSLRTGTASSESTPGAPAAAKLRKHTRPGREVLGRIEIPRLGITAIVAEGVDMKTLRHAIGHVRPTALPGRPGNCALAGHRDTFLRGLGRVQVNDVIRIVTLEGTYTYQVEWGEVFDPRRVDVMDSTATRSLTLITCFPFEFIGHAPRRFIVRAREIAAVAEAGTGRYISSRDAAAGTFADPRSPFPRTNSAAAGRSTSASRPRSAVPPQGPTAERR